MERNHFKAFGTSQKYRSNVSAFIKHRNFKLQEIVKTATKRNKFMKS